MITEEERTQTQGKQRIELPDKKLHKFLPPVIAGREYTNNPRAQVKP